MEQKLYVVNAVTLAGDPNVETYHLKRLIMLNSCKRKNQTDINYIYLH